MIDAQQRRHHHPTPTEVDAVAVQLPAALRIVGLAPAEAGIQALHPLEALLVSGESAERHQQFAAGRHCAHTLMATLEAKPAPLLQHRDGAPDWPRTVRGSISHKSGLCVAVAGAAETWAGVGVDVESRRALPVSVWARVFTPVERRQLEALPPAVRGIRSRLCFSAKECFYKWYRSKGGLQPARSADPRIEPSDRTRLLRRRWQFNEDGLMRWRHSSINDLEITDVERKFHWDTSGPRPVDHPGLTELGL